MVGSLVCVVVVAKFCSWREDLKYGPLLYDRKGIFSPTPCRVSRATTSPRERDIRICNCQLKLGFHSPFHRISSSRSFNLFRRSHLFVVYDKSGNISASIYGTVHVPVHQAFSMDSASLAKILVQMSLSSMNSSSSSFSSSTTWIPLSLLRFPLPRCTST